VPVGERCGGGRGVEPGEDGRAIGAEQMRVRPVDPGMPYVAFALRPSLPWAIGTMFVTGLSAAYTL
jgi:hypothetical protein